MKLTKRVGAGVNPALDETSPETPIMGIVRVKPGYKPDYVQIRADMGEILTYRGTGSNIPTLQEDPNVISFQFAPGED